jgi:hypothetical protein
MDYKIVGSTASAFALGAAIVVICFYVGEGPEVRALNLAIVVLGASTGWLAGVLLSPYNGKEKGLFPSYAAAVSTFASGYLISKADRVLEELLKPDVLFSPVAGFRLISAVSIFAVTLLITYIYRVYR